MMIPGSKDSISVNIYKCSKSAEGVGTGDFALWR
mgnify:CR=1 FL=1